MSRKEKMISVRVPVDLLRRVEEFKALEEKRSGATLQFSEAIRLVLKTGLDASDVAAV